MRFYLNFWSISLTIWYLLNVALTDNEKLEFDFGEGALKMATTSEEGSRRANYPIFIKRGSDKK
jgi:hypothetical protein